MDHNEPKYPDGLIISDRKREAESHIYTVIDNNTYPQVVTNEAGLPEVYTGLQKRRRDWLRWPYLIIYAILIAIISALIGGFAAKAIVEKDQSNLQQEKGVGNGNGNLQEENVSPSSCVVVTATATPVESAVPSATADPARALAVVQSDYEKYCADDQTDPQELVMEYPKGTSYWLTCKRDWLGDDLAPFFAENSTVCIESCHAWNKIFSGEKKCVGAGFNGFANTRRLANDLDYEAPINCWMKTGRGGQMENTAVTESAMALCLNRECK